MQAGIGLSLYSREERCFLMEQNENVKEIKITYEDGEEKLVTRGVCFSVYERATPLRFVAPCSNIINSQMLAPFEI